MKTGCQRASPALSALTRAISTNDQRVEAIAWRAYPGAREAQRHGHERSVGGKLERRPEADVAREKVVDHPWERDAVGE